MKWEEKEKEARWLWPSNCYLRLLLSTHPHLHNEKLNFNPTYLHKLTKKQSWRKKRWIWNMSKGSFLVWSWIWNRQLTFRPTIIFFVLLTCSFLISYHHHTTIKRMKMRIIWWLLTFLKWVSVSDFCQVTIHANVSAVKRIYMGKAPTTIKCNSLDGMTVTFQRSENTGYIQTDKKTMPVQGMYHNNKTEKQSTDAPVKLTIYQFR